MKYKTIKVYGSKWKNGATEQKLFKSLSAFEKWVGSGVGIVKGINFRHGICTEYIYAYKHGKRRSFNHAFSAQDYEAWNNWYKDMK